MPTRFDSLYMGHAARHLTMEQLEAGLVTLPDPPKP